MGSTQRGAFSHEERKAAVWALLIAAFIAALAMLIQEMTGPSLGPWGAEQSRVSTPDSMPGVLDARPVASTL